MKRMLKQLTGMMAAVLLAVSYFPMEAMAAGGFSREYERLMDMADLLTEEEEEELIATLDEISERQNLEIVVVTAENLEGYSDGQEYTDDLYEYCDFGYGDGRDGIMLLLDMDGRDWYISTQGYGITAFTDAAITYLGNEMKEDLSK